MILAVLAILCILGGLVAMICGKMLGLLIIFGGIILLFVFYCKMMNRSSLDPNQGTINGLNGQGKQQSEAVKMDRPVVGEQSANIWDQMEGK